MKPLGSHLTNESVHSVLGFIQSTYGPHWESSRGRSPFVTISRQAGAGGASLGRELVERLNARDRREIAAEGGQPWTLWDDELVSKVAAEHHLPAALVETLEEQQPSWLGQFLASLPSLAPGSGESAADEFRVYRRVAITIRALAEAGRVVVVGRGGAFITHALPLGVHVRLVAPLRERVAATASDAGVTPDAAAKLVHDKDQKQHAFYRRHWPGRAVEPESYTATLNTSAMTPQALLECVVPMVPALSVGARVPVSV